MKKGYYLLAINFDDITELDILPQDGCEVLIVENVCLLFIN